MYRALWTLFLICLAQSAAASIACAGMERDPSPWKAVITSHEATPDRLIAVDKSTQRLFLFENRRPAAQKKQFICTTGKVEGDKVVEGDLKTPEGIYFIEQYIGGGLDYLKYGNEAYTLNYPNPVDRVRQKTGYGIWIHGRGEPIVPLQTEGCVAMINEDLAGLKSILSPGTPVALSSSLSFKNAPAPQDSEVVGQLEQKVKDWADAWASRSQRLFDFYDKQSYTLAQGEPFSRFQVQKERLFKILPWIKIRVSNIRVLEGPGYWVTWFYQDYQAPNLTTKGVRRLYWSRDDKGEFKILGMEWAPGLTTGSLLASAEPALPPIEATPRTEEQNSRPAPKVPEGHPEASPRKAVFSTRPDHVEDPSMGRMAEPPLTALLLALNSDGREIPAGEWTGDLPLPERKMAMPEIEPTAQENLVAYTGPRSVGEKKASPSPETKVEPPQAVLVAEAGTEKLPLLPAAEQPSGKKGDERKDMNSGLQLLSQALEDALQAAGSVSITPTRSHAAEAAPASPPAEPPAPGGLSPGGEQASLMAMAPRADESKGPPVQEGKPAPEPLPASTGEGAELPPIAKAPPAGEPAASQEAAASDSKKKGEALVEKALWASLSTHVIYNQPATDIFYPPDGTGVSILALDERHSSEALAAFAPEKTGGSAPAGAKEPERAHPPAQEDLIHESAADEPDPIKEQEDADSGPSASGKTPDASASDLTDTVAAVTKLVEDWRKAWAAANLDGYMAFYAPKAVQGTRNSAKAIMRQKKALWQNVKPAEILLGDLRIAVKDGKVQADMRQEYSDSAGHSDVGIKTLLIENINGAWRITREDWSALPNEARN